MTHLDILGQETFLKEQILSKDSSIKNVVLVDKFERSSSQSTDVTSFPVKSYWEMIPYLTVYLHFISLLLLLVQLGKRKKDSFPSLYSFFNQMCLDEVH